MSEDRHRLVIDHFEGPWVVVQEEEGPVFDLPRWMFPDDVREGDVVIVRVRADEGETHRMEFWVDREAVDAGRKEAEAILARLNRKGAGGGGV